MSKVNIANGTSSDFACVLEVVGMLEDAGKTNGSCTSPRNWQVFPISLGCACGRVWVPWSLKSRPARVGSTCRLR